MKNKGLTLVELLIAMGISTVLGLLLMVIVINSAGLFYKESSSFQQGLNTNDALSKVLETVRQASSVAASYTSGSTTYTSGLTQLVLKLPSIDSSSNVVTNTYDYFIFFLDQNKFRMKTFPDVASSRKPQDQIFSTVVNSLNFKYLDSATPPNNVTPTSASKIRITLTLKQKSGANFQTSTATTEANLRND